MAAAQPTMAPEVASAVDAELARSSPPPPKPTVTAKLPAGQRRAIEMGFLADIETRRSKLAQFAKDGGSDRDAPTASSTLENLAEAT
jgi:hypothetical protein